MAQAELSRDYTRWALVVDEQELRRFCDECQTVIAQEGQAAAAFKFEVRFSDGFGFSTDSLDEILKEENPRSRAITGLTVSVSNREN